MSVSAMRSSTMYVRCVLVMLLTLSSRPLLKWLHEAYIMYVCEYLENHM